MLPSLDDLGEALEKKRKSLLDDIEAE